ncbi:MAG TPA: HAD family hydrolase [Thermoplasmata archaeon]|nr:HAD family hydrolase [Thermoplasmata archaeon]
MTLSYGPQEVDAILFDLDDVLVPFQTPAAWQWAWKPQGPVLGDRRVKAAVRRALKVWDRRRWQGLTGKAPPADLPALRAHLADTLATVAGHALPPGESEAVVRRFLRPAGEVERYTDVPKVLERLRSRGVRFGTITSLPGESARWLLHRCGIPEALLLGSGDGPAAPVPDRSAFRTAAEALGSTPERVAYVGDLFWSDVRAAARAGLPSVLLDRRDAWPKVQAGRLTSLDNLEATLAAGGSPSETEGAESVGEPSGRAPG